MKRRARRPRAARRAPKLALFVLLATGLLCVWAVSRGVSSERSEATEPGPRAGSAEDVAGAGLFGPSEGGERTSARHERVDDVERLLPDGGLAALGLSPGAPPELAIPAEHRLTDARAAIAQFAAHVSALEQERETASDPERRAQLDETLTVIQQRLQIAQIAERAIAAELASADRGANDQAQDVTSSRAATASAPRAD